MSAHSDNQGRFERPPTPPSPSSIYTSRVASPVSSIASHERSGGPHDALTPNNVDDLFEALLDRLNSGYLHRQSLKQQLQETEDAIVAANWDLFLLEHQSRQPQIPLSTADSPSSPPPPPPPRFRPPSPHRRRKQLGNQPSQLSFLTAARDVALSRRQRLWEEIKAATAGVEGQMGLFWRLLRERERSRGGRAAGDDGDVVGRVRRLLIPASLDELEGVRRVLDELLPRGLAIGSPRGGRPKKVAPGLQTWI